MPLTDGAPDTDIAHDKFHHQFAADLPAEQATLRAVTQRPVTEAALFGALRRPPPLALGAELVYLRRARSQHPSRRAPTHGRGGGRRAHRRDRRRFARRRCFAPVETAQRVLEAAGTHAVART
ncbi:MAG: hypothetical protein ABI355_15615 [Solirubrobacteraceae bacterium]